MNVVRCNACGVIAREEDFMFGMAPISSGALHDLYNDTAGNLRKRRAEAAEKPDD